MIFITKLASAKVILRSTAVPSTGIFNDEGTLLSTAQRHVDRKVTHNDQPTDAMSPHSLLQIGHHGICLQLAEAKSGNDNEVRKSYPSSMGLPWDCLPTSKDPQASTRPLTTQHKKSIIPQISLTCRRTV